MTRATAKKVLAKAEQMEARRIRLLPGEIAQVRQAIRVLRSK